MVRRNVLALAGALAVVTAAVPVFAIDGTSAASGGQSPPTGAHNVVLVLTDDMNYADYEYMPKTRALLGDDGVTFADAHHNTPLCCPARATLLTGQRSANHGVHTNKPAQRQGYQALDHSNTLATWLESAGYDTIHVGKYMNGYGRFSLYPGIADNREVPPGWSDWQTLVGNLTYDRFTINDNGRHVNYDGRRTTASTAPYQTDVLAERAVTSMSESLDAGRPFYLWVSTHAPHTYNGRPPLPAPRHRTSFDDVAFPIPPSYNESDVRDKPPYVRRLRALEDSDLLAFADHWENRIESLQSVDDLVESIYLTLERRGALDDTLIIFMSDNGYMLGEHRLEGKVRPYEEATHTPLVMRGGPFRGGVTVDAVVSSTDIVPTIVAQTGVVPQRVMDGIDLSSVVEDPSRYDDRAMIIEMVEGPGYFGLRTERWLYVEYRWKGSTTRVTHRELYDVVTDPYQLDNLAGSPAHVGVRNTLAAVLAPLKTCSGASVPCDLPRLSAPEPAFEGLELGSTEQAERTDVDDQTDPCADGESDCRACPDVVADLAGDQPHGLAHQHGGQHEAPHAHAVPRAPRSPGPCS